MPQNEPATSPPGHGGLVRVRLDVGYDGTGFSGWAAQPGRRTVEGVLSEAVTQVIRPGPPGDADRPVRLTVAGRTDAGVHARGQVTHADVETRLWLALSGTPGRQQRAPERAALARLRAVLPDDLVVHRVSVAPNGFDARFSAISRRYLYRICDAPEALDPLRRWDTVVVRRRLDAAAMSAASQMLLGLGDFAAFCKRRQGATTVRHLLDYSWRRDDDGVLLASITADAFCHSMVRSLVGAAVAVGEGRRAVGWPAEVLAGGQRGVQVMPARGLSLEQVGYPPEDQLGARAQRSRSLRRLTSRVDPPA